VRAGRRAAARCRPALPGGQHRLHAHRAVGTQRLEGVTEVRAGVYVFFDLVMAGVGVCTPDDVALSVLTTVIGHQPTRAGPWSTPAGWR
jgi:D-serine deaminase-like pyridoxal phosphate-dependent protein